MDYPAYSGVRTAVRTGNLKLRNACLRVAAPMYCGCGKHNYQWETAVHLGHLARMTDGKMEVNSERFSTSLGGDASSRVALDERQEVANRGYKGATKKITKTIVPKLADIVGMRERAIAEIERAFILAAAQRKLLPNLMKKRRPAMADAMNIVPDCVAFGAEGRDNVVALDGRVLSENEGAGILDVPRRCKERWADVIKSTVLNDKSVKGPTNVTMKPPPPPAPATNQRRRKGGPRR